PESRQTSRIRVHSVEGYTDRASSAFYASATDKKPLLTMEAFSQAASRYPNAASVWLKILSDIASADIRDLLFRIPNHRMSSAALEFAHQMLMINQSKLLRLQKTLL
ncbi:MAG: HipA-like protein, partial [Cyanobacteria bacterium J06553_1]